MGQTNRIHFIELSLLQVIYDTLIEQSSPMEVVAVLAHELGHWANWDTSRQLLIAEVHLRKVITKLRSTSSLSSLLSQLSLRIEACTVHSGFFVANLRLQDSSYSMISGNLLTMLSNG